MPSQQGAFDPCRIPHDMRWRIALCVLAAVALAALGAVVSAAPIVPNDPLLASADQTSSHPARAGQWALRQIEVGEAWNLTRGAGTVIAIVDDGVDLDHPDLQKILLPGATFPCVVTRFPCDGRWMKSDDPLAVPEHGTHVAGIAAGVANNGIGIAGVAPESRILPINVFQDSGASDVDVAAGIRWAVDHGATVVNLSLGDFLPVMEFMDDPEGPIPTAIAYALQKNVVVVAAAGNTTWPLCVSPSSLAGVICVAASDMNGQPAEYSSLPNKDDELALRAPGGGTLDYQLQCGGGIVSTVPEGFGDDAPTGCYPDQASPAGSYAELTGTSMAAPHVSGVAALVRSLGCDARSTATIVTRTAFNPQSGEYGTYDSIYGWGIVNAKRAVAAAAWLCHR
jgi:subtilisin family serine protease